MPTLTPAAEAPPTHVLLVLEGRVPAAAAADLGTLALALRATSPRPGRLVVCNASSAALPGDLPRQDDRLFPGTSSGLMDAFSAAQSLAFAGPGRLLVLSAAGAHDAGELLPPVMMEGLLAVPASLSNRVLHLSLHSTPDQRLSLGLPHCLKLQPRAGAAGTVPWAEMPGRLLAILRTGNLPDFLPAGRLDLVMLVRETCRQSPGWQYAFSAEQAPCPDWPLGALPDDKTTVLRRRILARLSDQATTQTVVMAGQMAALTGRVGTLSGATLAAGAGALDRLVLGVDPAGVECQAWLATLPKLSPIPVREEPASRPSRPPALVVNRPSPAPTKSQGSPPATAAAKSANPPPAPLRMTPQPAPASPAPAAAPKDANPFKGGTRRIAF